MLRRETVRWTGIQPATVLALMIVEQYATAIKCDLIVTSCVDGKHSENSLHYRGDAFDFKLHGTTDPHVYRTFMDGIAARLGPEFDVVYEGRKDGSPSHIHVEFQPSYSARERLMR